MSGMSKFLKPNLSWMGDKLDNKGKLDLANINYSLFYWRYLSSFKWVFKLFKKSPEELKEIKIIELGLERLKRDLNYKNQLDRT